MNKIMKIVLAVATFITWALLVFGLGWSIAVKIPIMIVACLLLTLAFSLFVYKDFKYFFGKK
jgi:hypothetical protein